MTPNFDHISKIYITQSVIPQTISWLREAGDRRQEAFVLWAGVFRSPREFLVASAICPDQTAFATQMGIGVHISGEEIFRVSRWLYDNQQVLLAQVHSHPTHAFHSKTDDLFPMVTAVGQFSIVVPHFARGNIVDLSSCAVFRLDSDGEWRRTPPALVNSLFRVME